MANNMLIQGWRQELWGFDRREGSGEHGATQKVPHYVAARQACHDGCSSSELRMCEYISHTVSLCLSGLWRRPHSRTLEDKSGILHVSGVLNGSWLLLPLLFLWQWRNPTDNFEEAWNFWQSEAFWYFGLVAPTLRVWSRTMSVAHFLLMKRRLVWFHITVWRHGDITGQCAQRWPRQAIEAVAKGHGYSRNIL